MAGQRKCNVVPGGAERNNIVRIMLGLVTLYHIPYAFEIVHLTLYNHVQTAKVRGKIFNVFRCLCSATAFWVVIWVFGAFQPYSGAFSSKG